MSKKLVCGIGVNDADYPLTEWEITQEYYFNGKRKRKMIWVCPYYKRWKSMLNRCYSRKCQEKAPTYKGCTVCEDWLLFSNFKSWMGSQDWEGKELDKDILIQGNKRYNKDTCVFIDQVVNKFITDSGGSRGIYLIGCHWLEDNKKFKSQGSNPFTKKRENLGLFDTEVEAHLVWKKQKHFYAIQLANSGLVTDDRVRQILLTRYKNYTTLEYHLK